MLWELPLQPLLQRLRKREPGASGPKRRKLLLSTDGTPSSQELSPKWRIMRLTWIIVAPWCLMLSSRSRTRWIQVWPLGDPAERESVDLAPWILVIYYLFGIHNLTLVIFIDSSLFEVLIWKNIKQSIRKYFYFPSSRNLFLNWKQFL